MATAEEIQPFLNDFQTRLGIWGLVARNDREKNTQALLALEMSSNDRKEVLKRIVVPDYSEGPLSDTLLKGMDMWVFGKIVKQKEIYIKIALGMCDAQVLCISFHPAEYPMRYPLRS